MITQLKVWGLLLVIVLLGLQIQGASLPKFLLFLVGLITVVSVLQQDMLCPKCHHPVTRPRLGVWFAPQLLFWIGRRCPNCNEMRK
jgi:hypothetical protein